ncbi:hypothetical protein [Streptomyces katsurahamanus]|uniref:Transposase n=1 Tax=Streptomyces katsurahamanus TaxID=2577098 RepID=A0ABW9P1W8_9ACTN|nr:hypothetical protein [Streptomyces katsurahamanus]MQS39590.1 hypothetical protein [Streptomyces katsurahamanus]
MNTLSERTELIAREVLRLEHQAWNDDTKPKGARLGRSQRSALNTRRKALRWALHVLVTGERAETPGDAVEALLETLSASLATPSDVWRYETTARADL